MIISPRLRGSRPIRIGIIKIQIDRGKGRIAPSIAIEELPGAKVRASEESYARVGDRGFCEVELACCGVVLDLLGECFLGDYC